MDNKMTYSQLLKTVRDANPEMSAYEVAVYTGSIFHTCISEMNRKIALDFLIPESVPSN